MSVCIYKIINNIINDFYIGKTTKPLQERLRGHYYNSKNPKTFIQKAINKYGIVNFSIHLIEENVNDEREVYWIKLLSPRYNLTKGGEGGDTSKSINFRIAMKNYHSNKPKEQYATYGMRGKSQTDNFYKAIKKSNNCPVECDGVFYESVGKAQEAFPGCNIRKRLNSFKYPTFIRLREKTKRK